MVPVKIQPPKLRFMYVDMSSMSMECTVQDEKVYGVRYWVTWTVNGQQRDRSLMRTGLYSSVLKLSSQDFNSLSSKVLSTTYTYIKCSFRQDFFFVSWTGHLGFLGFSVLIKDKKEIYHSLSPPHLSLSIFSVCFMKMDQPCSNLHSKIVMHSKVFMKKCCLSTDWVLCRGLLCRRLQQHHKQ